MVHYPHMIEVERKYRLTTDQFNEIKTRLLEIDPSATTLSQEDTVFLHGISSFKEFSPGMPVVRIRTENGKSKLTYKKALNEQGDSIEHEVGIDNADTMHSILSADDYQVVTKVTKDRLEVKDGALTYALDTVRHLGFFLEIEVMTAGEDEISNAETQIKAAAEKFGLTDTEIETKKYDQLMKKKL